MGTADAIADMAHRVQLNGPEPTYAIEKLSYALFKAAEGLALCDVEIVEVTEEARRGHEHGVWLKEEEQMTGERHTDEFTIHPVSSREARLRVTATAGSVVVLLRHAGATAGVSLTANEARVLANVLNATARRTEAMTLSRVRTGDIVLCDRMGRVFYAIVIERHERELEVEPIDRRVTYHHVKAREVLGIWRKGRAQNGRTAETVPSVG
jgi:hypothetical protein